MVDRYVRVGGDPLIIEWHIQKHIMFNWEIDTEALEPLVPKELTLVEIRPGVSLYSISGVVYTADNFYPGSPAFFELVSVAHVHPDLSLDMPMCRFAMHAISVYSDSPDFVKQEGEKLFTPTRLVPSLVLEFSDRWDCLEARDADGPICSLRNTYTGAPTFRPDEFWGQHYNDTRGLHRGIWQWDGPKFEHQARGDAGKLHPHPFYKGMDLSRVRGCYRQMLPQVGGKYTERFYGMHQLRA